MWARNRATGWSIRPAMTIVILLAVVCLIYLFALAALSSPAPQTRRAAPVTIDDGIADVAAAAVDVFFSAGSSGRAPAVHHEVGEPQAEADDPSANDGYCRVDTDTDTSDDHDASCDSDDDSDWSSDDD